MEPVRIEFLMVDKLSARLDKAVNKMDQMTVKTTQAGRQMQELDKRGLSLQKTIGRLASAFAMKELVSKIAIVRGEYQQLDVAFKTMLGNAEQADALMQQLTRTAAKTRFGLEDVAQGGKQLLAYGLGAEKVNETLIRLGDIASGVSVPLSDLVYLYGTTMAQGRLYTQDLNQFTGRGIPMIGELAKLFGVAESKVKELVEEGKVGFPEVQKVIENLTDEGGKFGGLMEAQSKTIAGQISNIEDAISMMFNELGQQGEGVINTTLSGVSYVIEHYERFGRILLGLVGTYGVYRTAVMTVAAAKSWATAAEMLHYNWLLLVEKAQKMLNTTMLANPYVLVATLIAGVVAAMVSMKTEAERLKEAEEAYEAQKQKIIEAEEEHRRKIEELCSIAGDEAVSTDTRREALNRLEQKYPDIFSKYDTEYEKLKNIKKIKEEIALLDGQQSISQPKNELTGVNKRLAELQSIIDHKWTETYYEYNETTLQWDRKTRERRGTLSKDQQAEYKMLLDRKKQLNKDIRSNEVNAYFENLTGVSNETLAQQIRQRETLLAQMTMQEKKYGRITQGSTALTGTYSRDELQYQLNKLKSERNRRNLPTDSSSDWVASAGQKYRDALKAYNDFIKNASNNLTREEFEKKAKELKDAVDAAKKEYDKVKPGTDSNAAKEAEKRKQVSEKLGQELAELQRENDASEIEAMDEGLQKKLRQIDNDYQARKNEIDKQESDWKRKNKEAGWDERLSDEQQSAIDNSNELNESKRQRAVTEAYREEFEAMQEHLRAYGTYQQQKLAITEEYAEKIRKASSESEKRYLGVERDSLLAGVEAQELKANIDWSVVFGEFGGMFHDLIAPELKKAKAYTKTVEFRNADHDSQEVLISAIRQMEQSIGGADKVNFKKLGTEITAYHESLADLKQAQEDYESTYTSLSEAQQNYIQAVQSGTKEEQDIAKVALDTAQANADAAAENVSSMQMVASEAQRTMTGTATTLKSSMDGVVDGLRQIASGSLSGAYEGLIKFGNSAEKMGGKLGKAFGKVADALEDVPIIGWIVQIIDLFKDGLSVLVGGILDAVFNAVSGILSDILSGDLFVTIGESLLRGIGKIFDAITFGGFSSWFGSGESDKTLQEDIEYLTTSNEDLRRSIDNLADKMEETAVSEATGVYEEQKRRLEEEMANTQEMMRRSGAAYSNGFLGIGGAHSSNTKINDAMSSYDWDRISAIVGRPIRSAGAFWGLSSEEMAKVAAEATDLYSKIKSHADDGHKNAAQYMDEYIEYYKQLEELQEAYYEKLTGVSFDSVRDKFKSTLLDMNSDVEDFAEDLNESLLKAVVEGMMSEGYSDRLRQWYKNFADSMKDGSLTDKEAASLRAEYERIVADAINERNALMETLDIDPSDSGTSQSAKAGGFSAMTQDQGTKLEGMFTSGLQHWSSMDEKMENVSEKMNSAENHLAKIEENTGKSAEHLEKIAENVVKIIRDGLKVK